MPRLQWMPAAWARAVLGRMPAAMTTRSAATSPPSEKRTAATSPASLPTISVVEVLSLKSSPRSRSDFSSSAPATGSSWRSSSQPARCTTVTSMPRCLRPLAASSPSSPPPITTAFRFTFAVSIMVRVSWMSR